MHAYVSDVSNSTYKRYVVDPRLRYFKPHTATIDENFADEVTFGLTSVPRFILPKFFYDSYGSKLFDEICSLPEYYLTRAEISILRDIRTKLGLFLDSDTRLVELGSGTSTKTRLLLDILFDITLDVEYFPIDISDILTESSELLLRDYPQLRVTGIIDTFDGGLEFLQTFDKKRNLLIFLGSSFGNFAPEQGRAFLQKIYDIIKPGDLFLIGLDLVKDVNIIEAAYNDLQGVTAKFNLNVLSRINNELDADFVLDNFEHYAFYNPDLQRVEMYIRSLTNQSVIATKTNMKLLLKNNELIHTEFSYKYKQSQIHTLLSDVGFDVKQMWTDKDNLFSLTLASKPNLHI